ncbi:hypothetical protein ACG33_07480 [Steroidobacter denitrificans]|uniref:GtrA/DPMS transmembrane domain-containing protein n=1 Tax=Steroidobacter denitrificans TaxID=465721 RepID=A0A127FBL4_STEDE|nr:GtrA family protein [Steroidobacter denitrificans]AMN46939.1 hypothetical protein ACG33_07480 [Steroidobacter denitrificans]
MSAQYAAASVTTRLASSASLIVRYMLFALLATLANLASQWTCLGIYDGAHGLYPAILTGTAVGLIVKFWLDKRWIYSEAAADIRKTGAQFVLYTLTGIATTLLFWGTELLFDRLIGTQWSKYLGAMLGLAAGYTIKYRLDVRFVFAAPSPTRRTIQQ